MKHMMMIVALALSTPLAFAQETPSGKRDEAVKVREEKQQKRIENGINNGSVTPGEAANLEKGEQRIQNAEKKAMSDGKMTAKESRKIERMENRESRKIAHKKHNSKHE